MTGQHFTALTRKGERVALALGYDGSLYRGWQSQRKPQVPTVQECLESSLSQIANAPVRVHCAGRTDAGVHASFQVVHFDSPSDRDEKAWVSGSNTLLPDGISVQWARPVAAEFHARFSATARRYRYIIANTRSRPSILASGLSWQSTPLDHQSMHLAGQALVGELDFTSFRAVACQSNTPKRNVHFIKVSRNKELVVIDIQANAFLYHMVRNIAGSLLEVGMGHKPVSWVKEVLAAKDRCQASVTASPKGLYLVDVCYPEVFKLPVNQPGPIFFAG